MPFLWQTPNLSWLGTGTKYADLHMQWRGWNQYNDSLVWNRVEDVNLKCKTHKTLGSSSEKCMDQVAPSVPASNYAEQQVAHTHLPNEAWQLDQSNGQMWLYWLTCPANHFKASSSSRSVHSSATAKKAKVGVTVSACGKHGVSTQNWPLDHMRNNWVLHGEVSWRQDRITVQYLYLQPQMKHIRQR